MRTITLQFEPPQGLFLGQENIVVHLFYQACIPPECRINLPNMTGLPQPPPQEGAFILKGCARQDSCIFRKYLYICVCIV
jgi:hypothetical protein